MHTVDPVERRPDVRRMPATGFGAKALPIRIVVDALQSRLGGGPVGPAYDAIVCEIRPPRTSLALVVGAGLAVAAGILTLEVRAALEKWGLAPTD